MARAWYTHIVAGRLQHSLRIFSRRVSVRAIRAPRSARLVLEHQGRLQTALTDLVTRHLHRDVHDAREFVRLVKRLERVNIVTFHENYDALRHKGNYRAAGIRLKSWQSVPVARRRFLWFRMLRGRVANSAKLGRATR